MHYVQCNPISNISIIIKILLINNTTFCSGVQLRGFLLKRGRENFNKGARSWDVAS